MKSPFTDIDGAFMPFFDEEIVVTTNDGRTMMLSASIFTDGTSDPLTDGMMETEREDMTFLFRKCDWAFVKTLKRGDEIQRNANSKKYSVSEAKLDNALGWVVSAREK